MKRQRNVRNLKAVVRPKTPQEWAAYRCQLSCQIGRDALDGKNVPKNCSPMEYAMFNLFHAVEELSRATSTPNDGVRVEATGGSDVT